MQTPRQPRRPLLTQSAHHHLREAIQTWHTRNPAPAPLLAIDATAGNGHDTVFLASLLGGAGEVAAFDIQKQALESTAARLQASLHPEGGNALPQAGDSEPLRQADSPQPTPQAGGNELLRQANAPQPTQQTGDSELLRQADSLQPTRQANADEPARQPNGSGLVPQTRSNEPAQQAAVQLAKVTLIQASHAHMPEHLPAHWQAAVCAITFNLGYLPGGNKALVTLAESTLPALNASLQLLAVDGLLSVLCYRGHSEGAAETEAIRNWLALLPAGYEYAFFSAADDAPPHAPLLLHIRRTA